MENPTIVLGVADTLFEGSTITETRPGGKGELFQTCQTCTDLLLLLL